jgi:hypothetical protein
MDRAGWMRPDIFDPAAHFPAQNQFQIGLIEYTQQKPVRPCVLNIREDK